MYKKGLVNGIIYDIIPAEEYHKNKELYENANVAVEKPFDLSNTIYPVVKNCKEIGFYPKAGSGISFYNEPQTQEEIEAFSDKNIIDFSNVNDIGDVIRKNEELRKLENQVFTNPDNITKIKVDPNDSPEMRALKEAINNKEIDLDKYKHRFGSSNYLNNKRLLNNSTITMDKLKLYGDALDIKISLTMTDKDSDVPNPIGKKITVDLTGGEN